MDELAADGFRSVPRDNLWPVALSFLADTCLLLEDEARPPVLLAELDRVAGLTGPNEWRPSGSFSSRGRCPATRWSE